MTASIPSLDDIRRDIDRIDDAILALLAERALATTRVRARKSRDGSIAASPIRPAREAIILRRLIAKRSADIHPETVVRLWRGILVSSTLSQAPVRLHLCGASLDERLALRDHFGPMAVVQHQNVVAVLAALKENSGDIAALCAGAEWAVEIALRRTGARAIAALPCLGGGAAPSLLIFGLAPMQPSGDDVTLLIGALGNKLPMGLTARWQWRSGDYQVLALNGFLTDSELLPLLKTAGYFNLAGRYPAPIEV